MASNCTVDDLSERLAVELDIPSKFHCLLFHTKRLKYGQFLADYNVQPGDTVQMILRICGGMAERLVDSGAGEITEDVKNIAIKGTSESEALGKESKISEFRTKFICYIFKRLSWFTRVPVSPECNFEELSPICVRYAT